MMHGQQNVNFVLTVFWCSILWIVRTPEGGAVLRYDWQIEFHKNKFQAIQQLLRGTHCNMIQTQARKTI